jgi:hypothetical protein
MRATCLDPFLFSLYLYWWRYNIFKFLMLQYSPYYTQYLFPKSICSSGAKSVGRTAGRSVTFWLRRLGIFGEICIAKLNWLEFSTCQRLFIKLVNFINTTPAAATWLPSIKIFPHSLHILLHLKINVPSSSCSFLIFGNTVTGISSCFVRSPCLNNCHSLPLHTHFQPALGAPS